MKSPHCSPLVRSGGFLAALFVSTLITSAADPLPAGRRVTWQGNAGIVGGIPTVTTVRTMLKPSGGDDTSAIQSALASCPSNQVVLLTNGVFNCSGLDYQNIPNGVVLRGMGPGNTKILLTATIMMRSTFAEPNQQQLLSANVTAGDTTVFMSSVPSWVTVNSIIWLSQLDDPSLVLEDGCEGGRAPLYYSVGQNRGMSQLTRVLSKTATSVTVETPAYWPYSTAQSASIAAGFYSAGAGPRTKCGIENMTIEGNYANSDSDLIKMESADSCWVYNCTLTNLIGRDGVYMFATYRCQVEHCYIGYSHYYSAGQGYGIGLYNGVSASLVQNNIFDHLHIGVDMSFSAAGNVIAYNYFRAGQSDSGQNPSLASHGCHNWMTLLEGNWAQEKMDGDVTHGSGSHMTYHRDRIVGKGTSYDTIPIMQLAYNRKPNVIGCVLGLANYNTAYDNGSTTAIFSWGGGCSSTYTVPDDTKATIDPFLAINAVFTNGNNATLVLNGFSTSDLQNSYYLNSKPSWFGSLTWPQFNPAVTTPAAIDPTNIPAGYRYVYGVDPPGSGSAPPLSPVGGFNSSLLLATSSTSGSHPLTVQFSNGTSGGMGNVVMFGDGTISSNVGSSFSHTYSNIGTYNVSLQQSGGLAITNYNYIRVTN